MRWMMVAGLVGSAFYLSGDMAPATANQPAEPAPVAQIQSEPAPAPAAAPTAAPTPAMAPPAAAAPPRPPQPRLVATIDLSTQRMTVTVDGHTVHNWPISSGRLGHHTPTGSFRPQWASRMHYSRKYDDAPMPYSVFFNGGIATHGTNAVGLLGQPASHGCIRLNTGNAQTFYNLVNKHGFGSTRIVVRGSTPTPTYARRPQRPQTYAYRAPAPRVVAYAPKGQRRIVQGPVVVVRSQPGLFPFSW